MARRSIYKILLPAMRFLTIIHAFLGLIYYEEKDEHFSTEGDSGEHSLFPLGDDQDLAIVPRIFSLRSWKKHKPTPLEHTKESLEKELPETNVFHLAMPREADKRKRKRVIRTPFGEFVVSELFSPFQAPEKALV